MEEEEKVVLVDPDDNPIGTAPKLQAHLEGRLHRAISVFVFNDRGEMLLQRRAESKYHSGGLWSNTCCSHPRPGEETIAAADRRLREEMGFQTPLEAAFTFLYRAELEAGLVENELDHVFVGTTDAEPMPDPREVDAWRWIDPTDLRRELAEHPETFTAWFPIAAMLLLEGSPD
jgi:isopentenyl-diphosphate Delta-isomerase